jgi:hypothetical protein
MQAIAPGSDTFAFRATSANNELEFLGFEVYYRIFAVSGDSIPTYFITFEDMVSGSFQRLYDSRWAPGAVGFSKPLIAPDAIDHGTDYDITIDFNFVTDATYPQVRSSGLTTEITIDSSRRSVEGLLEWKRFDKSEFVSGERDLTPAAYTSIASSQEIRMVMFAVSYGFDASKVMPVYSPPVLIGKEDFIIPDLL